VVAGGKVVVTEFDPQSMGIARSALADLRGGDAEHNAGVIRAVLAGERGSVRDIVVLNAAAAIAASEGLEFVTGGSEPAVAEGLAKALAAGAARAAEAIDSGAAAALLTRWAEASTRLAAV
jgi:anthranilate phosphoribosyltransferase